MKKIPFELERILKKTQVHLSGEHARVLNELKSNHEERQRFVREHQREIDSIKKAAISGEFDFLSRRSIRTAVELLELDINQAQQRLKHIESVGQEQARKEWVAERNSGQKPEGIYTLPFEGLIERLNRTVEEGPHSLQLLKESLERNP